MSNDDVPVLIAGGSLVGLSTSLFLADHGSGASSSSAIPGRPSTRARRSSISAASRSIAGGLSLRSPTHPRSSSADGAIVSVETMAGKELEYYFRNINEGVESLSPSPRLFITQIGLEPILRDHAEVLGGHLEYGRRARLVRAGRRRRHGDRQTQVHG